jgi:hypothetical protein
VAALPVVLDLAHIESSHWFCRGTWGRCRKARRFRAGGARPGQGTAYRNVRSASLGSSKKQLAENK